MDRLYFPLARTADGVSHLIFQNTLSLLMFTIAMVGLALSIKALDNKLRALLTDTSTWVTVDDVKFNVLPNGRIACLSPDGVRTVRSMMAAERLLQRRMRKQGKVLDTEKFRAALRSSPMINPSDRRLNSASQRLSK